MSRLRADNLTNRAATGAPLFTHGASVTGVVTATSFDGNVTGNADTATTAINAQGLTGTPSITVNGVTASTLSGNGASITNIDGGNIATGIVTTTRLGSGTANSTTFLNGHGQFAEAGGGAWTYLATVTASNSATMEFTSNIDSTYDTYAFVGSHLIPTVDSSFLLMQYYDTGGSWTLPSYGGALFGNSANTMVAEGVVPSTVDYFKTTHLNSNAGVSNLTERGGVSFIYYVFNPSNTTYWTHALGQLSTMPSSSVTAAGATFNFSHVFNRTQAVTGVRFRVDDTTTGNIASGTVRMYGIKNS
jgi:hypothetical protein